MTDCQSPTTRRRWLACISALLGASIAGCSLLGTRQRNPPESLTPTEWTTQIGESSTGATTKTTTPRTTASRRTTTTKTATTSELPDLNRTPYPVVQQRTDNTAIPEETVVLSTDDWRDSVAASKLTDETVQFVDGTDFESSFVVAFEVNATEAGYYLRLEAVERDSDRARIEYSDVLVEGGPNVERWRAMFVRLPRRDGVPETVALERTDEGE